MEAEVSQVFEKNRKALNEGWRLIANEGSSSSTKTYSILQVMIEKSMHEVFSFECVAVTVPHIKSGALNDFLDILDDWDIYEESNFNRTDRIYKLNGCTFKFSAYETEKKAKGPRRDYLHVNEADLIDQGIYFQLSIRTRKQILIDYNPAYDEHWVFDMVDTDKDCKLIKSTYKDNPFLRQAQVNDIEEI